MIQSNELRKGNRLYSSVRGVPAGAEITIFSITQHGSDCGYEYTSRRGGAIPAAKNGNFHGLAFVRYEEMEGIPLTPDILEKCGFKDVTDGYRATGSEGGLWRISMPHNGKYLDLHEDYDFKQGRVVSYFMGHYENKMFSLHQLQNLFFALTGQELEVKL